MEKYEGLILEVIRISDGDIITTSNGDVNTSWSQAYKRYEDEEE